MNLSFVMAGLDAEFVASPLFPDSIVKQPSANARILCGAGYAVIPSAFALRLRRTFLCPSGEPEGMERRAAQPSVLTPCGVGVPCDRHALATRRSTATISVPGAVTSGRGRGPPGPPIRAAFAALRPCRVQPTEERSPIVGTDGDPRPPGSGVTSPARRRRIPSRCQNVS
jgi:hypothetical protein